MQLTRYPGFRRSVGALAVIREGKRGYPFSDKFLSAERKSRRWALPKLVQNTWHICVEGWDVIGNFGGTRASDILRLIGADTSARLLGVECVDGYYESIDMETVLHPQTPLCYEMYRKPLDRGHGAPLRLQMPLKSATSRPSIWTWSD